MLKTKKVKLLGGSKSEPEKAALSSEGHSNTGVLSVDAASSGMKKSIANATSVTNRWIKPSDEDGPIEEPYTYEDVIIGNIVLDANNTRTRHILPNNPTLNKLEPDHPDYLENQDLIDGLIELAEQLKITPLQSSIGVYSYKGKYKVVFGSRRFLAMKIAFGDRYKISCKVYEKEPSQIATARFIENSSRKDLILSAKVQDFKASYAELNKQIPESELYKYMGISNGSFYNYKRICENETVYEATINKVVVSLSDAKLLLDMANDSDRLNLTIKTAIEKKINIQEAIAFIDKGIEDASSRSLNGTEEKEKRSAPGRKRTSISFPKLTGKSAINVAKKIIDGELKGMDWSEVNWDSIDSITNAIEKNITELLAAESKDA